MHTCIHAHLHTIIHACLHACLFAHGFLIYTFTLHALFCLHAHCLFLCDFVFMYWCVLYWFQCLHAYNDMYLCSDQFDVCVLQKDEIDLLVCMLCFQLYGLCLTCLTIFILICVRMLVCVFNCGLTVGFCSAFIFAVVFICKNMYMCFIYSISRNGPIGPKTNMDKQSSPHQNLVRDWFWCGNLSFL